MIVVLDTNVIISALNFGTSWSAPVLAVGRAVGRDSFATCDEIEQELTRILREKFDWSPRRIERELHPLLQGAIRVTIHNTVHLCRDPDDDKILECAERAGADLIVTGDQDLLALGRYGEIRIVSPAEYLAI